MCSFDWYRVLYYNHRGTIPVEPTYDIQAGELWDCVVLTCENLDWHHEKLDFLKEPISKAAEVISFKWYFKYNLCITISIRYNSKIYLWSKNYYKEKQLFLKPPSKKSPKAVLVVSSCSSRALIRFIIDNSEPDKNVKTPFH